jgi:CrcB protein
VTAVAAAIGSALGAVARYLLDGAIRREARRWLLSLPAGTIAVNVTGSFALGVLAGLALFHGLDGALHTVAGTGFVGSYTTFSAFAHETIDLAGRTTPSSTRRAARLNLLVSVVGGLAASALGIAVVGLV